jgi:FAD/FMN-containing dehydrogenase
LSSRSPSEAFRPDAALKARSVRLTGWGRYPLAECKLFEPGSPEEVVRCLSEVQAPAIARGKGRSYGDSSLSPECTIGTRRMDRMLAFDEATGWLSCEGGALLSDIIDSFMPRGWFAPVTPGTKFVTVGGMIASDVHGKNHHVAGSFCDHVSSIDLAIGDGQVLHCSRSENAELFEATCGGMGLTGVILRATLRLLPIATSRIEQTIVRAANLDQAMAIFDANPQVTYSVAWIDSFAPQEMLGRSVVMLAEHAALDRLPSAGRRAPYGRRSRAALRLPFDLPAFVLNAASIKMFNALYYRRHVPGTSLVDLDRFFYPLDALHDWNRMYGRAGFVQYQCVLPLAASRRGLLELLTRISRAGLGSFLAVLKRLGRSSFGHLSFPMEGYTLALDFPVKERTFELLDTLDAVVAAHGGRVYLTKDARAKPSAIIAGYPRLEAFRRVRDRYGLSRRFQSLQSTRLEL